MTPQFRIENIISGIDFGIYSGPTAIDALNEFARDAGYVDYAELDAEFPADPGEIKVTEVNATA